MSVPSQQQEKITIVSLLGIGLLLLFIAIFLDPIGSFPDSGMFDLGKNGTRWLLASLGAVLLVGGGWIYFNKKS
ncbi:MAG: hypothetical protein K1X48_03860 [Burkholderiaceae bacterium]|nr:hypothetical protein [Burkholderiaceae bacterium]